MGQVVGRVRPMNVQTFITWVTEHLPNLRVKDLELLYDFETARNIPDKYLDREFRRALHRRFGIRRSLQDIAVSGWYQIEASCLMERFPQIIDRHALVVWAYVVTEEHEPGAGSISGPISLATGSSVHKHVLEPEGEVIELREDDLVPLASPNIIQVTLPPSPQELASDPHPYHTELGFFYNSTDHSWYLKEVAGKFCVNVGTPGSLPFQRAARIVESNLGIFSIIVLQWIFAKGRDDVLQATQDALQHGSAHAYNRSNVQRLVQAALA